MRSDYVKKDIMDCVLMAMNYENRKACEVSLRTGLRISDVLTLKSKALTQDRISIKESKTGKQRRFTLPKDLREELASIAGKVYIFEHRTDQYKHRCRQTVYKDIKKAAEALNVPASVSPHTCRKIYAVERYNVCGDMKKVQELLNHSDPETTMLYAMADVISERTGKPKKKRKQN